MFNFLSLRVIYSVVIFYKCQLFFSDKFVFILDVKVSSYFSSL